MGLEVVEQKVDALTTIANEIRSDVKTMSSQVHALELWKERTEGRLTSGAERMGQIETKQHEEALTCEKRFNDLDKKLDGYVEKKVVLAYLIGMGAAAGGVTATLMKLLSLAGH